ncbi:AER190Wp [Eremothecium gossypii ATCC 10895]|uniref:AER190Wp n=1 Tax=Eremothecium gossypii (strain ATCC 10895 / CBS 109.51 / FGSC 9923 / NRRL Y-1056) TaxID=284811 RepID=Q756R4_EREGS|nr:AER190Wp [Eremothecium gossypii ATCC 10895]AAS52871.1 AER190Wp [Eremothecium gossypii ATCC 10895]AEY97178.1 FAER190Wp [Eremothecium gossypii FDAG1]
MVRCATLFTFLTACISLGSAVQVVQRIQALPHRRPGPGDGDKEKCPPCFNCMLPGFECKQYSKCNPFTGRCDCRPGFGGDDCSQPLCGALSDRNDYRPARPQNEVCECGPGWGGINCNMCEEDAACDSMVPSGVRGTCYRGGMIVHSLHQGCNITNEKIVEMLGDKKPQVTFACNKTAGECDFQFWIDQEESFYCGLNECNFNYDLGSNSTHYECSEIRCECIPGRMLCGQKGSIDISEFLTEEIRGPGEFSCNVGTKECHFSEPSMDELIGTIFGDSYIKLRCSSGECLHYSEVPGYLPPPKQKLNFFGYLVLSVTSAVLMGSISLVVLFISRSPLFSNGHIELPEYDSMEEDFLKSGSMATLTFENLCYKVFPSRSSPVRILNSISGYVSPGEILAVMGGSGAGKTCLLDILGMKNKAGEVSGTVKINGVPITKHTVSKVVGFVDQDNHLLPTLTVYETVLNSALLRLPRSMSFAAKQKRVYQVLEELRIFDIRDRLIGNDFERGISGGEKRRVSIACELVTSPLILFLDEPTSGLDSNNANNVIECLVRLASQYRRTLVLSIHQPRSNIFRLFDNLVLLNEGEMVYSGPITRVNDFLRNTGFNCPSDYNIADYLIDINFMSPTAPSLENPDSADVEAEAGKSVENSLHVPELGRSSTQREWEHFALHRDELRSMLQTGEAAGAAGHMSSHNLSRLFKEGSHFGELLSHIEDVNKECHSNKLTLPSSYQGASFLQQLSILNSRSFKNIYRNPKLLIGNYVLTVILGLFLGALYYGIENDISGFQNRLGLFFFVLTYFGFLTFTGLSSFAQERIIFVKERSNNYYSPVAFYVSKVLSDILPLRVVPPILLCLVIYPLVGLNMSNGAFLNCIGILVLFNLSISMEILAVGLFFEDLNNSIVFSVLILLGSLLFCGLFVNTQRITNFAFRYMKNLSVFYYAYEALIINEVKSLTLRDKKYGLNIEIPGATILSSFGFSVQHLQLDIEMLGACCAVFLLAGYLVLQLLVIEHK